MLKLPSTIQGENKHDVHEYKGHKYGDRYDDYWLTDINNVEFQAELSTEINFIGIPTIIGYLTPYITNAIKEFAKDKLTTYGENLLRQQLIKFTEKYLSRYLAIGFAQIMITLIRENWTTLKNIGQSKQPNNVKGENITKTLFNNIYSKINIRKYIPTFGRDQNSKNPTKMTVRQTQTKNIPTR